MEPQKAIEQSFDTPYSTYPVEVIKRSQIAVLQDSSEIVHWPQNEDALFHAISDTIPWLEPKFFDEYSLDSLFVEIAKKNFSALIISASAMASALIRTQLNEQAECIYSALVSGMGISISAPYLTDVEEYMPKFFGPKKVISLRNGRKILLHKGHLRLFHDDVDKIAINAEINSLLSTRVSCTADISPGWISYVELLNDEDSTSVNLGWSSKEGLGTIQVSVLPLERLDNPTGFYRSLINLTRAHGIGVFRAEDGISRPWFMERKPVNYLIIPRYPISLGEMSKLAGVVRYVPPISTFEGFDEDALRVHIERGGSFECRFKFPDETPCQVSIGGIPDYLDILRAVEVRVDSLSESLATGPTFSLVAYSFCAYIARTVVKESSLVPTPFRQRASAAIAGKAIAERIANGSVDMRLLPTINVLASALLAGIPGESENLTEICHWVRSCLSHCQDEVELEQVRWILQLLTALLPDSKEIWELLQLTTAIDVPKSMVGQLSRFLDVPEEDTVISESGVLHSSLKKSMAIFTDQMHSYTTKKAAIIEETDADLTDSFRGTESDYYLLASTVLAKRTEVFHAGATRATGLASLDVTLSRDKEHLVEAIGKQQDLEIALERKKEQVKTQADAIRIFRAWSKVLLTFFILMLALLAVGMVFVTVETFFPESTLSDWVTAGSIGFATWVIVVTAISFIPGANIVFPKRMRGFTKREWKEEDVNTDI